MRTLKTPIIEVDCKAGAIYVRLARGKVVHQEIKLGRPNIIADYNDANNSNTLLGFEVLGKIVLRGRQRQKRR